MKAFRRLFIAVLLMLAFTLPVLAGDVHVPGAPAPGDTQGPPGETQTPPSAAGIAQTPGFTGETHGPGFAALGDIGSPGLASALLALLNLL